jgi:hypothetical protein
VVPQVIVIILNWNGKDDTIECLESLRQITYANHEILLVDNGSTDGSAAYFREKAPDLSILENGTNLGFAEGNNVGIRWALSRGADYVLLLNNDTVVDKNFLQELVDVTEKDRRIGFVGPKIYHYDYNGRRDVISFAGAKFRIWRGQVHRFCANTVDEGQCDSEREVDSIEGSCLLVRTDVIKKVGLLNSDYYLYWEDTEWCIRGRNAGYKAVYVPGAKIWHKVGMRVSGKRDTAYYYGGRNRVLLVKQYATSWQLLLFLFTFLTFDVWSVILVSGLVRRKVSEPIAFIRGIKDALLNKPQARH